MLSLFGLLTSSLKRIEEYDIKEAEKQTANYIFLFIFFIVAIIIANVL